MNHTRADSTERQSYREADVPMPQVIGLFRDAWDENGTALGWLPLAWGLRMPDGSAITASAHGPLGVTLWLTVDDAASALDAHVTVVEPRHVAKLRRAGWT